MNTWISLDKKYNKSGSTTKASVTIMLLWLFLAAMSPTPAFAVDDDIPFFAGANGAPNIMFIFDNSDSMQDIPYLRADGRNVRPGTNPNSTNNSSAQDWPWRRGVKLNADGTVNENPSGVVQYNEAAYPSDIEQLIPKQTPNTLPGSSPASLEGKLDVGDTVNVKVLTKQTPPNLPGNGTLTGGATSFPNTGRIYDTNLDWATVGTVLTDDTLFNLNYRYRLVEVRDKDNNVQTRTISSRSVGSKYFTIDTSVAAGGPLVYAAGQNPFTYTILADAPGRVTQGLPDTRNVVDANLDWTTIPANWDDTKLLTVTAGTNVGESRIIDSRDTTSKRWYVKSYNASPAGFTAPCDHTTRYSITDLATDPLRVYPLKADGKSLDWATGGTVLTDETLFNLHYRYRVIQVIDKDGGVQERTISSRSVSGKYFAIEAPALAYDPAKIPYTFKILTDGPGRVTRLRTDVTPGMKYVTDADLDWTTINTEFDAKWKNRTLRITEGTNAGLERKITDRSTGSKYWSVDVEFPVQCDLTTRYTILGTVNDDRLAFGGNHPASKLYQAKKAINLFLQDKSLKNCTQYDALNNCTSYKYSVNMGFATYLSARVPRSTALYYRQVAGNPGSPGTWVDPPIYDPPPVPAQACGYYKRLSDTSSTFTGITSSTFTSTGWKTAPFGSTAWVTPQNHTGVTVGYKFDRLYNEGGCEQQTIHYTVTAITPDPTDSQPNQHRFTVSSRKAIEGGYWNARYRCFNVASCANLPANDGGDARLPSTATCFKCTFTAAYDNPPYDPPGYWNPAPTPATPAYYQIQLRDTYGHYNISNTTLPQYVDRTTHLVQPWFGYSGTGWTPKTNPNPLAGDYTLVTSTIANVPINSSGTLGNIVPNTFDTSYFAYPGYGTEDRPHGWSYKKSAHPWIYGQSDWWNGAYFPHVWAAGYSRPEYPWPGASGGWDWSTWSNASQVNPYFPATVGNEMSNFTGNDQVVFVNLPQYNDTDPNFGDDITGVNFTKILEYTSLSRFQSPNNESSWTQYFDYTIMPYTKSIAPNAYSAQQGSGTPLAASLQDVKKYCDAYIETDAMTQGNCRNNYVILLTDGLETGGGDPVAAAAALNSGSFPVKTYVVGMGLDTASQIILNNIAVAGGTGHAYFANNVESLVKILVDEITSSILGESFSRSAPAVTPYVSGQDLNVYSAYFDYPSWRGHFIAYKADSITGHITGFAPGWLGDCDLDGNPDGDAGCEMRLNGRGTVYTSYGTPLQRIVFDPNVASSVTALKTLVNPNGADIDGDLTPNTATDTATVMQYTLNPAYDSNKYRGGARDTAWPLGDIYNSAPTIIGPPRFTPPAAPASPAIDPYLGYTGFKADQATRGSRVYIGANDGMVHAFKTDNGREDWAYIPNGVLRKINEFKEGHRFTVDLPLKAADIYSSGGAGTIWTPVTAGNEKNGWHTLLSSGLRKGGNSYFALDVTNPTDPKPVWEVSDTDANGATRDMGNTWSVPSFGRISINGVSTYVVFVGGGTNTTAQPNVGNNVYIIDASSGVILKEFAIGSATNYVPSEITVISDKVKASPTYGNIINAYFGDNSGDLWKLTDLNDDAGGPAWAPSAVLLYDGVGKVFHRPAVASVKGGCKVKTMAGVEYTINANTNFVHYGTGDEEHPTQLGTTDRMYEIADPPLSPVIGTNPTLVKVWEQTFPLNQKMLTDPSIQLDTVYFVNYTPEGGCAQGESFLWGLTTTKCGKIGGEPGLIYNLSGNTTGGPWSNYSLGSGITSSITLGGPVGYIKTGGKTPPVEIKLPSNSKLEYWRENF